MSWTRLFLKASLFCRGTTMLILGLPRTRLGRFFTKRSTPTPGTYTTWKILSVVGWVPFGLAHIVFERLANHSQKVRRKKPI